jgi:SSS family solute:Na+ symporter
MELSWVDISVVGAYVLAMLGVGFYVFKRSPGFEEYLIAGRSMTTPVLICTLASTYYGLDVLFGTSEIAYNDGVVAFFGYSELSLGFYILAAYALSKPLRKARFTSLPEILERGYGRSAGVLGAVSSILYSVPALSLFALGRITEVMFGIDARVGALMLGSVALVYTLFGGLLAVAVTDTLQFVVMCLTLVIAIPILMGEFGGFDAVAAQVPASHFDILGGIPIWLVVAYAGTGISILVDPGFYQRIFAARSYKQARNAMLIALVVWGAYDWLVTAGGMLARTAVELSILAPMHSNDALLTAVVYALPIGLVGLFLAGVLATSMSTIDSYSLVAGANMSYDIYRPLVKPDANDEELVRMTKRGIVVSWIMGYLLAFMFDRLIALWVFNASLMTSTVFVPIMATLFWKGRKTPAAGICSFVFGMVSVALYYFGVAQLGVYDDVWGTYIWTFAWGGEEYSLWQEYSLFFSLPMSFVGFLIGNCFGSPLEPTEPVSQGAEVTA